MAVGIQKLFKWFKDHRGLAIGIFVALLLLAGFGASQLAKADDDWSLAVGLGAGLTNDNEWITQEIELRYDRWHLGVMRTGDDSHLPDTWRYTLAWGHDWREGKFFRPCIRFGVAYWQDQVPPLLSENLSYHMVFCGKFGPNLQLDIIQHNSTAGRAEFNNGVDTAVLKFVAPLPF